MRSMRSSLLVLMTAGSLLMLPLSALAADAEGNYAIRGAGSQACDRFVSLVDEESEDARLFVDWMEGYTSALNRLQEETFDVTPFLNVGPLTNIVLNVCRNDRKVSFEEAVARVLRTLSPARVEADSKADRLEYNDREVMIRRATLRKVQQELREAGHYQSSIDGLYGPGTRNAIIAYQEEAGLDTTGLPDPQTLLSLLLDDQE